MSRLLFTLIAIDAAACDRAVPTDGGSAAVDVPLDLAAARRERSFTADFRLQDCHFATVGRNPYFPLVPGRLQVLEGKTESGVVERLEIRTFFETKVVGGIPTRIVEERHTEDGELVEVSRNFFAHCVENGSVFYFGEEVDIYEGGKIVRHDGSWRHGANGAHAGVFMPGLPLLGARYHQEIAPEVALDRAEIVQLDGTVETPAGRFRDVLVTDETTVLEPGVVSAKRYSPGTGLVADGVLRLVAVREPGGS